MARRWCALSPWERRWRRYAGVLLSRCLRLPRERILRCGAPRRRLPMLPAGTAATGISGGAQGAALTTGLRPLAT